MPLGTPVSLTPCTRRFWHSQQQGSLTNYLAGTASTELVCSHPQWIQSCRSSLLLMSPRCWCHSSAAQEFRVMHLQRSLFQHNTLWETSFNTIPDSSAFPVKKARFPRFTCFSFQHVFKIPRAVQGDKLTPTVELDNLSSPRSQCCSSGCTAPTTRWSSWIYTTAPTPFPRFYPWIPAAIPALKPHFLNPRSLLSDRVLPSPAVPSIPSSCLRCAQHPKLLPQMCPFHGVFVWLECTTGRKGAAQLI